VGTARAKVKGYAYVYMYTIYLACLEAVGEVSSVGEVESHQSVVWLHQRREDCEVGGRAGVGLDVDSPLIGRRLKRERKKKCTGLKVPCAPE